MPALLSMRGVVKRYDDIVATDHVDLDVHAGEIHALLGENGAGKTTLMNVLYGVARPDEGEITLAGKPIAPASPAAAIDAGIGMVHQHPLLVEALSVAENLCLGGVGDSTAAGMRAALVRVERTLSVDIDPKKRAGDLPLSQRQRIEIARCLARGVQLLILDEPTAVLAPEQVQQLFAEMRRLADSGRAVVFITHRLAEVEAVADRVTVLRGGQAIAHGATTEFSQSQLAQLMVGSSLEAVPDLAPVPRGPARLELERCSVRDAFGHVELDGVTLSVHGGEIVCLAGVEGNGQRPLAQVLFGLSDGYEGEVRFDGAPLPEVEHWRSQGIAIARIPEERRAEGLMLEAPLWRNLLTGPMSPRQPILLRRRRTLAWAADRLTEFAVKPADPNALAASLSGGNQQKVVLARELSGEPKAVIGVNPTRGLDISAQRDVHARLLALRAGGIALLIISTDLDEVQRLADRVGVLYRGRLRGPFPRAEVDRHQLGHLMAGISAEAVGALALR